MEGKPMVSYSTGSLNFLVDKLNKQPELKDLLQDLENLKKDTLDKFSGCAGNHKRVNQWMKQVRELAYDIEDWIDLQYTSTEGFSQSSILPKIEIFRAQIHAAQDRCTRYEIVKLAATSETDLADARSSKFTTNLSDENKPGLNKSGLVALDGPILFLVNHLTDKQKQLKVVSVLGEEGLGKTTLAKAVLLSEELKLKRKVHHPKPLFVCVGPNNSLRTTLLYIGQQFGLHPYWLSTEPSDQELIHEVWKRLRWHRYLIVLDDIRSIRDWTVLRCTLPDNDNGSRILITTRIKEVAEACSVRPTDVLHQMKALSEQESKELLNTSAAVSDEHILKLCKGIPLAIIVAAGLLTTTSKGKTQLKELIDKSISPAFEPISTLQNIFHISLDDMPLPVKSCFLYFSVFPENYTIKKDRLIRRWMAEGLIPKRGSESLWVTGESYCDELLRRRLIQPEFGPSDYGDEEFMGYNVNSAIHEFVVSMSTEENFGTLEEYRCTPFPRDAVRRLTLYCSNQQDDYLINQDGDERHVSGHSGLQVEDEQHDEDPRAMQLSRVRTLTLVGKDILKRMPFLVHLRFIRVLDLEDAVNFNFSSWYEHGNIGSLRLLKYLGLRGTYTNELPEKIEELQSMETLDLRGTRVRELPNMPQKLVCLLIDEGCSELAQPDEIGGMLGLEELSTIKVTGTSADDVSRMLANMNQLRILGIHFWAERVPFTLVKLVNLIHLDIRFDDEVVAGDLILIGKLSNLILLKIHAPSYDHCIVTGGFRNLEVAWFMCMTGGMGLQFQLGAMRKLRLLRLRFNARRTKPHELGVQFPPRLTDVQVTIDCSGCTSIEVDNAVDAVKIQVDHNPNHPKLKMNRSNEAHVISQGNDLVPFKDEKGASTSGAHS